MPNAAKSARFVAGGCAVRDAAHYVRCSARTIRREAERDPDFHQQLRRSEMYAQLSPLRSMQQAVATHWRAAAWMLELAYPDRFARRDPAAFAPKQARRLLGEVLSIISSEVPDVFQYERIEKRLRPTFEYIIRDACDSRRTSRNLRRAMQFFEQKERHNNDPFAQFGFPMPNQASPHDAKVGRTTDEVGRASDKVGRGSPDPAPPPPPRLRASAASLRLATHPTPIQLPPRFATSPRHCAKSTRDLRPTTGPPMLREVQ